VGVGCVVLTADEVLHDGDVVSHSDGIGTTTTRTPVSSTTSISFGRVGQGPCTHSV